MKTSDKIFALLCGVIVVVFAAQRIERHLEKKAWEKDRMERIAIDFRRSREEVKDYISRYIPEVTDAQIDEWTALNLPLQNRVILAYLVDVQHC